MGMFRSCVFLVIPFSILLSAERDSLHTRGRRSTHVTIGFSQVDWGTSTAIGSAYGGSGYVYFNDPLVYSNYMGVQFDLTPRLRVGGEIRAWSPRTFYSSNWYKQAASSQPVPNARFDVWEKVSANIFSINGQFVLVPFRIPVSRFEVAIGSGMGLAMFQDQITHKYLYVSGSTATDDTTFQKRFSGNVLTLEASLNVDFYWSRVVSTQFRITGRNSSSVTIPAMAFEYWDRDARRNRIRQTRSVSGHKLRLSGVDMSLGLVFHL